MLLAVRLCMSSHILVNQYIFKLPKQQEPDLMTVPIIFPTTKENYSSASNFQFFIQLPPSTTGKELKVILAEYLDKLLNVHADKTMDVASDSDDDLENAFQRNAADPAPAAKEEVVKHQDDIIKLSMHDSYDSYYSTVLADNDAISNFKFKSISVTLHNRALVC